MDKQPPQQQLTDEVKNLGRKARARLEEEKSKRREIQRLLVPVNLPETAATTTKLSDTKELSSQQQHLLIEAKKKKKKSAPKKRRRISSKDTTVAGNSLQRAVQDVDRWVPSCKHLDTPVLKEDRSNVVQLHGVPKIATPSHIRRFFSGLEPQRILLLPNNPVRIVGLDADYSVPRKAGLRVDRNAYLRVLVKFDSAPTAALAAQRSREVLQCGDEATSAAGGGAAAMGVTHMARPVARYLITKLAFDAVNGRETLEDTVTRVGSSLDAIVPEVLWTAAIRELQLTVNADSTERRTKTKLVSSKELIPKKSRSDEPQLRERKADLLREMDRLRNTHPFPRSELLDPTLTGDPVLQLNSHCVDVLQNEVDCIDAILTLSARWNMLITTRPTSSKQQQRQQQQQPSLNKVI